MAKLDREQRNLMERQMGSTTLAGRFKLAAHFETKQLPALRPGGWKSGPKLTGIEGDATGGTSISQANGG